MSKKQTERAIRDLVEDGALEEATERTIEAYGDEIYNYIRQLAGDPMMADDLFQEFSLKVWNGWETFDWTGSFQAWLYTIARNTVYDELDAQRRDKERPLQTDERRELVARWTRTVTKNFEKTEAKQWLWNLVEELEPDKRELVVLRIGHRMTWKDVARVVEGEHLDDDELRRASRRLRKRYQRVKETLKKRHDEFDG